MGINEAIRAWDYVVFMVGRHAKVDEQQRPSDRTPESDLDASPSSMYHEEIAIPDDPTTVLHVCTLGGGGIHQYVDQLVQRLPAWLEVDIYDMRSDPKGTGAFWAVKSFLLSLVALVLFPFRTPPDIVHVHSSQSYSFYRATPYVLFATVVWKKPTILHIHGSAFDEFLGTNSRLRRWLQQLVLNRADRVVVLSDYWYDVLRDRVDDERITVIPNAVDAAMYDPQESAGPPVVTFVSNLVHRKGVEELIETIDVLTSTLEASFEVNIAGTGPLADRIRSLADREDVVSYHGYVSESDKRQLLSTSSIFVLPTHAEGMPIALLEGMAGGNAVISTTVGSIPEVVDDHGGILIDPNDADELRWALQDLIVSPTKTFEMGQHNRRLIEARYTWEIVIEAVLDVYQSVRPVEDGMLQGPQSPVSVSDTTSPTD